VALTACGGGSSSSGGGEEAAIEEAIETSATSSDPSKCTEVQTEAFNETETGKSGKASLEACEEEAETESEPAESVSVSNISESGETATADVEVEGGSLSGQAVKVEVEEKLGEEEGITPALAKCVSEGVAEMSQDEAEAMVFEKSSEGVEEIAGACNE
jgi:hypothetical protein